MRATTPLDFAAHMETPAFKETLAALEALKARSPDAYALVVALAFRRASCVVRRALEIGEGR